MSFSEFSYGLATVVEICQKLGGATGMVAAPLMPTLVNENVLGYDVRLDMVHAGLFLQFKKPQHLTRPNAKQWSDFGHAYFRFALTNELKSPQHDLLCRLQAKPGRANAFVFYAVPAFSTGQELNAAFLAGNVCDKSLFLAPLKIGRHPVGEAHVVVYSTPDDVVVHSEPVDLGSCGWASAIDELVPAISNSEPVPLANYLESVVGTLEQLAAIVVNEQIGLADRVARAVAQLDCQLILLGSAASRDSAPRPIRG